MNRIVKAFSNFSWQRVLDALIKNWQSDKLACISEFLGTAFTIIASMTLAINAKDPNMVLIFPIYQLGTIGLAIAYYRRDVFWSNGLMWYFLCANSFGFFVAIDVIT